MLLKYYPVVLLCFSVINGEPGEPKCLSRFDYDEKMLMKQLRFEDKVQKFEDFINGINAREAKEKDERDELFAVELEKVKDFNNGAKAREANEKEGRDKLFAAELEKAKEFNNGAKAGEAREKEERDKLFAAELEKVKEFNNAAKAREAREKEERDKLFAAELKKVKNFQRLIDEVKTREEKELEERSELFLAELKKYKQENAEEVERQKNVTSEMLESMANSQMEFENVHKQINERMKGKVVAFTVTKPKMGDSIYSMSFRKVITNEGNAFDTSTGKFTCPVSGLYYFSLHIIKYYSSSVDYAGCYINLNGSSKVRAITDPQSGANRGRYGVSTSVYLKLMVGDVVMLDSCSMDISVRVESETSFSGHLEQEVY